VKLTRHEKLYFDGFGFEKEKTQQYFVENSSFLSITFNKNEQNNRYIK